MSEAFKVAAAVITSLGGGVVIIAGFTHWLGGVWAKRLVQDQKKKLDSELEQLKGNLRKSDYLFEKEYEAVCGLVALKNTMFPRISRPDMEWEDLGQSIADEFEEVENRINIFLTEHGAILSDEVRTSISKASRIAGNGKFVAGPDGPAHQDEGQDCYKLIEKAEKLAIKTLHDQAKTG